MIPEEQQEIIIQKKIAKASLQLLEEKYGNEREQNQHLKQLFSRLQTEVILFQRDVEDVKNTNNNPIRNYQNIYLELLEHQRNLLNKINEHSEFDEDLIRKYLSLIDIEEYKLWEKRLQ